MAAPPPPRRALVLGGGGITGVAWEIGLLAGLAERGVDVTAADLVVGTSAGSVVGALLRGGTPLEELYRAQLEPDPGMVGARLGASFYLRWVAAALWPAGARAGRARLGRGALRARTIPEADWRAVLEGLVGTGAWPEQELLVTAVDAESGELRVFGRESGVALAEAVAASCAVPLVWPPVGIQGRRYMDGGVWSGANAHLATGCRRVLVVAPITYALRRHQRLSRQLRGLGPDVLARVVSPDRDARRAIGRNVLDPGLRGPAARAGREQALRIAEGVAALWSG